jgi:pantetheine-phosphate adenylyltransferase
MKTIAIFAGSFDPPTLGHLSLIRRARQLWDELVVLVAVNPAKQGWLSAEERAELLEEMLQCDANICVDITDDLVVAVADRYRQEQAQVVLLRGVRDADDLDYELVLAHANRELGQGLETVFLPAAQTLQGISSTQVRERIEQGEPVGDLLHPKTAARLRQRGEA